MKKLHQNNKQRFTLKPANVKPSWFIGALLFIQMIFGSGFAQNQKNAWLNGEAPDNFSFNKIGNTTLTIEYENFPLYSSNENKIKITSSDKNAIIKVILPKEKPIEFKESHIITYKPMSCFTDKIYFISGKDTIHSWFSVSSMPNPTLFFDSINENVLLRDEIFTAKLQARLKNKTCKILHYKIIILGNVANNYSHSYFGTDVTNQNSIFAEQDRNRISFLEDGDIFYLADVLVEMPDGSSRIIDYQKIKLIKHKYQRDYCNGLHVDKNPIITKSYCDLRIKIEIDSLKNKTKIFESFFKELNKEMNGVKVKLVNILPDITFTNEKYLYRSDKSYNFFYPDVLNTNEYIITFKRVWSMEGNNYQREEVDGDKIIEVVLNQLGLEFDKSTVTKDSSGNYHLTPLSKEHLNNLYTNGSINRIYKELKFNDPRETGTNYILIIVIFSTLIFLVIKEFIISTNFGKKFFEIGI